MHIHLNSMKKIFLAIFLFLAALPSFAVFNERDLAMTLQVLRYELSQTYREMETNQLQLINTGASKKAGCRTIT